ncbi:MAG: response regulator [Acidobacteriota bacterium]|jgi:DNA-binding response OmpR family regulator
MARVLVVEDEAGTREVLCASIAALGHDPDHARDGIEALERFRTASYDMVVTDLAMPRMDGIELTRRLRETHPGVAVLMVTGQTSLDLMVRAVNRGISDYLSKPFPLGELERSVTRVLDRRGKAELRPAVRRRGRLLGWLLALLAVALLISVAWRAWAEDAGLHELSRAVAVLPPRAP